MFELTLVALALSIAAQLAAALIALRHLRSAGAYRFAWLCLSAALLLMIERRAMPLLLGLGGDQLDPLSSFVGLAISLLMVSGIYGLRRLVDRLREQEAELTRQAHLDYLTQIPNRRYFLEQAELNLVRALRYDRPLSMLMLDIDTFKSVNDTHGHAAGDLALVEISGYCKRTIRETDIVGRWGGEEFAILLPETGKAEAVEVAERLRKSIDKTKLSLKAGLWVHVTISIGVATLTNGDTKLAMLFGRADTALYRAKDLGRNRVEVAE
jgi:diguanylate cyclase (GGDEF)-like protein